MYTQVVPNDRKHAAKASLAKTSQHLRILLKRGLLGVLLLMMLLALMGLAYQFIATRVEERNFLPAGQRTNVGGSMLHIHCTESGSPTVILEGGLGGTSLDWSLVQPELPETTHVCSYDRAGLGWSELNPADLPRTGQQIAGELHALHAYTGIPDPYVLPGLSAGGMHVEMFANQYPHKVLGLILVDPTPARLMARSSDEERENLLPNLDQFNLIKKLEPFGLLRLIPLPGFDALMKSPEETRKVIRAVKVRTGAATAIYQDAAGFETSILQIASLPPLPAHLPLTVVGHGILSEPLALEPLAEASLHELTERVEHGQFVVAEDSEHYTTFGHPDVVIGEINALLEITRSEP